MMKKVATEKKVFFRRRDILAECSGHHLLAELIWGVIISCAISHEKKSH